MQRASRPAAAFALRRGRRMRARAAVAACVLAVGCAPVACGQSPGDGDAAMRAGRYTEAAAAYGRTGVDDPSWPHAQRWLVRAYLLSGKYDEAERAARAAATTARGVEAANALGEALAARGKYAAAESSFTRAAAGHAADSLTARRNLALLHWARGERDRALAELDAFIDAYNASGGSALTPEELVDVAIAVEHLGVRNPQLFKDALKAYDRAIAAAGASPIVNDANVRVGELFLAKYNSADAQRSFDDVLRVSPTDPRALLGTARRKTFDNERGTDSLIARVLAVNPDDPAAHVLRAEILIDLENYAGADSAADRALAVNPVFGEALAVKAAGRYLSGDRAEFDAVRARALAANPHDAELFATLGELASRVRQYREAARFAAEGVALDAQSWRAHGVLGLNRLRLGEIASGRASLETAFAGDPYNVWIKNTLDLLDTFRNYDEVATGHFVFMVEKSEAPLLVPYLAQLGEDAYARFARVYDYTPPPPIRIEVYRSHADFSVRTVGLAGLGALGVSFGTTLAFDSPAARDAGPFNWGSTVWHELAHTFTLGSTEHRVPRWLSEGLSVYEERRAQPGWGFDVSPAFLDAYRKAKLVPVSRMNDGFLHPAYPEQVMFSYYQASLVCELIARDFGEAALPRMLTGYREGLTTPQVFERVLKVAPARFDRSFDAYMQERFGTAIAGLDEFRARTDEGKRLLADGDARAGIAALERARAILPQYAGGDGPLPPLVHGYQTTGDTARAIAVLRDVIGHNEADYEAHIVLSTLLAQRGDTSGAARTLDAAMYISPFDLEAHQRLAALWRAAGDRQKALRERQAVVALAPVDRAEALYQLALAQRDAGDAAAARATVVRALEEAPNFERAQELLLELRARRTP